MVANRDVRAQSRAPPQLAVGRSVGLDEERRAGRDVAADRAVVAGPDQALEDVVREHQEHFGQDAKAALGVVRIDLAGYLELQWDALRAELEAARELVFVRQEVVPLELVVLQQVRVRPVSERALQELPVELVVRLGVLVPQAWRQPAQVQMASALLEVRWVSQPLEQARRELRQLLEPLVAQAARRPEEQQDAAGEQRVQQLLWLASRRRHLIRRQLQLRIGPEWCCVLFPRHLPELNWSGSFFRPLRSPAKGQ
jgi:hypothetical protein